MHYAFQISEQARARAILDLVQISIAKGIARVDAASLREEQRLLAEDLQIKQRLRDIKHDGPALEAALREQRSIGRRFAAFERNLEKRNPAYAALKYPKPLAIDYLTKRVLRDREVMLEYFTGRDSTFLFVLTKDGIVAMLTLRPGQRALATQIKALRLPMTEAKEIRRRLSAERGEDNPVTLEDIERAGTLRQFDIETAHLLYQELVEPAWMYIKDAAHVTIVPHGPLFYLPFELLAVDASPPAPDASPVTSLPRPRYLLDAAPPISYALSAALLDPKLYQPDKPHRRGAFIAFANPAVDAGAAAEPSTAANVLPSLAFAEGEVNRAASLYGKAAKVYTGRQATKTRFIAEAPLHRDVLVATHGLPDDQHPMASALVFAQETAGEGYTLLNAAEIFSIPMNAELVALSACDLGGGTIRDGEGILGFTRAFIHAGSANIVLSLWLAADWPTAALMEEFFLQMRVKGAGKAEALRASKLAFLIAQPPGTDDEPSYAHPFFWASFVVFEGPRRNP